MACFVSRLISVVLFLVLGASPLRAQSWKTLTSGGDTNLRGISAAKIPSTGHIAIWASGSHGVILRSLDEGATWTRLSVPGQPDLDFRGVVAISDATAYLMSSGEGDRSRIYKTTNGGQSWEQLYTDINKSFFLDSIACLSEKICFALGDPINGKFLILHTADGRHWIPVPPKNLPDALPKEGAFAASNSNLLVLSESELYVVTGGFAARVLHTTDAGKSWTDSAVPIAADNASSGIFAITRSAENQLVAVGGDYANAAIALCTAAISSDNAKTWQSPAQQPTGYRSAVTALNANGFLAVGPTGTDFSNDNAAHWNSFPAPPLNAIFSLDETHVYAARPKGTIAQFIPANPKMIDIPKHSPRPLRLPLPISALIFFFLLVVCDNFCAQSKETA
jgi:photosystem II stability/assembly factor-like uncharacterized protein